MPYKISNLKCWDATNIIIASFVNFSMLKNARTKNTLAVMQYKQSVHIFEEVLNTDCSFNMRFLNNFLKSRKIKFIITSNF